MEKILKFLAHVTLVVIATITMIIEIAIKLLLLPIGIIGFLIVFLFWPIFQKIKRPIIVDLFSEYVFINKWITAKIIKYYSDLISQM